MIYPFVPRLRSVALAVLFASCSYLATPALAETSASGLLAGEVVERIKANLGVPWKVGEDGFKTGDDASVIRGVTVTLFPTYEVLQQAARSGNNLIVCHEPLFYTGVADEGAESDPVLLAKRQLIEEAQLVVYRFHDNIHRMQPDGIHRGLVEQLQWSPFLEGEKETNERFVMPEATVGEFAARLAKQLDTDSIRVLGRPSMRFTNVGLSAGACWSKDQIKLLRRDDVQVLVIGESREWQTVEYVRDAIDSGQEKALVILGHAVSEEAGMKWCADWLKSFINKVPVAHVPSGEPYWTPAPSRDR
jgi:putative NIF3 family GTP cyclohydrolase 1 type 2